MCWGSRSYPVAESLKVLGWMSFESYSHGETPNPSEALRGLLPEGLSSQARNVLVVGYLIDFELALTATSARALGELSECWAEFGLQLGRGHVKSIY